MHTHISIQSMGPCELSVKVLDRSLLPLYPFDYTPFAITNREHERNDCGYRCYYRCNYSNCVHINNVL